MVNAENTSQPLTSSPPLTRPNLSADSSPAPSSYTSSSSREGSPPRATTTITTTTNKSVTKTTEITHLGAKEVLHELSKDGSGVSVRPQARRSKSGKNSKIKQVVNFRPRVSTFDRFNPESQVDPFRGFYTLFWIVMAVATGKTIASGYLDEGKMIGLGFAKLFSEDALMVAATDGLLIGSTFLCVPFVKMIQKGWFRYYYTGLIMQHVFQAVWLGIWICWTFFGKQHWPWVQSGFLTLHSISMLMKIHSYCSSNGLLAERHLESQSNLAELEALVSARGGWATVLAEAEKFDKTSEEKPISNGRMVNGSPLANGGPLDNEEKKDAGREQAMTQGTLSDGTGLHRRKTASAQSAAITSSLSTNPTSQPALPTTHRLLLLSQHHPDETLAELAKDTVEILEELSSTVDERMGVVTWPENVSVANFWDYLLVPSLVYEIAYPRTTTIRPMYILEKVTATFGTFSLIYIVTQYYVWDRYPKQGDSFALSFGTLMLPFMVNYLLIFYIIFECICNAFAEMTRFADREFYSDWWNSTSFDEFARKWNKPVHNFLLRHVYASTITAYGLSKAQAALVTFFLSALMHELLMAVVTKKLRMYLFGMQMAQLPLIAIGQMKIFKKNPGLGNLFFWIGLMSGFPLLGTCYILY